MLSKKLSISIVSIGLLSFLSYTPLLPFTFAATSVIEQKTGSVVNIEQQRNTQPSEEDKKIALLSRVKKSVVSIIAVGTKEGLENYLDILAAKTSLSKMSSIVLASKVMTASENSLTQGTGFFINNKGYIMTNKHVVEDMSLFYGAIDEQGTIYMVEDIQKDPLNDIAIIKVTIPQKMLISTLPIANETTSIVVGQTVYTIGNSLGKYMNSVSEGIISGLHRTLLAYDNKNASERLFDTIQTDAGISQGNSGGPLVNKQGTVLGMNTAFDPQGENIGFAITAKYLMSSYKSYLKYGYIPRPFLGVQYVKVTKESAKKLKLTSTFGAYITSDEGKSAIMEGSPAEKGDLQRGDIILSINGELLMGDRTLSDLLSLYRQEETIRLIIKRGNDKITKDIKLTNLAS